MSVLRKAKNRLRSVQDERRRPHSKISAKGKTSGYTRPPKVSLRSIESSMDESFDKFLDHMDETSNPLFQYDNFEEPGTSKWQQVNSVQETEPPLFPSSREVDPLMGGALFSSPKPVGSQGLSSWTGDVNDDLFSNDVTVSVPDGLDSARTEEGISAGSIGVVPQEQEDISAPIFSEDDGLFETSMEHVVDTDETLLKEPDIQTEPIQRTTILVTADDSDQAGLDTLVDPCTLPLVPSSDDGLSDEETDLVYYSIPSVDHLLEQGIPVPRSRDHLSPHDSPLSSLPSSYEPDDNYLERHPFESEHPLVGKQTASSPALVIYSGENEGATGETESRGSSVHTPSSPPLDGADPLLLSITSDHPLSLENSTEEGKPSHGGEDPLGSFVTIEKDDLFLFQDDYFARDPNMKETAYGSGTLRQVSGPRLGDQDLNSSAHRGRTAPPQLPKRNSSGKVPPPRPEYSPKLRQKVKTSGTSAYQQNPSSSDTEQAEVKLVRPLGLAPPQISTSPPKRASSVPNKHPTTERLQSQDELFPLDVAPQLSREEEVVKKKDDTYYNTKPDTSYVEKDERKSSVKKDKPDVSDTEDRLFSKDYPTQEPELIPELEPTYHLLLACILYLYYSLNTFSYISGLLAGFLLVYLTVGAAFIYFVHHAERTKDTLKRSNKRPPLSQAFVDSMKVSFDRLKVYQSNKFTATFTYDLATHHPSDRCPAEIKLLKDFRLIVRVRDPTSSQPDFKEDSDIRQCKVSLEPLEVAQNRKRRWSKKFPVRISWHTDGRDYCVYLFSPTSREKEDWFRRLRSASNGITSKVLIEQQKDFFAYMQKYFPAGPTQQPQASSGHSRSQKRHHSRAQVQRPSSLVQFSKDQEEEISITKVSSVQHHVSRRPQSLGSSGDPPHYTNQRSPGPRQPTPVDEFGFEMVCRPPKDTDWINAMAARLCWDVWHEERWKNWVMGRIQRKLIRVKTPSFMEQLQLTDVELGNDMPVINFLRDGPKLDLNGIWVYLDVTYQGSFIMTIETKLKLGAKGEVGKGTAQAKAAEMLTVRSERSRSNPPHHGGLSHFHAARSLGSPIDPDDIEEIDSGSDDEGGASEEASRVSQLQASTSSEYGTSSTPAASQEHTHSRRGRLLNAVSKFTKRVANTRIVRRAAEKVSSYPLVLTVVVKRLDGVLAVNIAPPPSDTVWYGFKDSPHLELVAKPKLGHREVTLSHVTHWIEKKLCELVDKKLLLPNMEDLVIPLLNSGLPEDKQSSLMSPTTTTTTTTTTQEPTLY